MKRNILVFSVIILANVFTPQANALFGYGENKKEVPAGHPGHHLDTVEFWQTVEDLLKKNGYDENSDFYKHAHANLQRIETMHAHHKAKLAKHEAAASKKVNAEKLNKEKAAKHKTYKEKKEREAFEKGKKSGEAHERRLLKKKAAHKTTETKTPRKKHKKVVKEESK